jgi:uncharacterized membrane protein YfcA
MIELPVPTYLILFAAAFLGGFVDSIAGDGGILYTAGGALLGTQAVQWVSVDRLGWVIPRLLIAIFIYMLCAATLAKLIWDTYF